MTGEFAVYPSLRDRTVFITGGASGIGRATVETLLENGAKIYIADLNTSGAEPLVSQYGTNDILVKTDVSSLSSVKKFFAAIERNGDPLYGAVNAAGINLPVTRLHETTDEFYEKTKRVDFDGVFYSLREELKLS